MSIMSDLMERTTTAQALFDNAIAQDTQTSLSAFRSELNEKQLGSFDVLMRKRESLIMVKEDDIYGFFDAFKGVAFLYPTKRKAGAWSACGFSGNRSKPDFRYWFDSKEEAQAYTRKWAVEQIQKQLDKKRAKAEKQANAKRVKDFVSVGDVFVSSWGYEQTNIDYYKVVGFRGESTLELIRIGSHTTPHREYMCGTKTPDVNTERGDVFTKRAQISESFVEGGQMHVSFNLSSYKSASLKRKREDGTYSGDDYSFWA